MSSNNDNAMTRFLFAILRQKCLKDIDWNKVARDPILVQEISNGHAARMRYSRFRASMLGLEPQRRNRTTDKNRVSKPKKEAKESKGAREAKEAKSTRDENDENDEDNVVDPKAKKDMVVKQVFGAIGPGSPSSDMHDRHSTTMRKQLSPTVKHETLKQSTTDCHVSLGSTTATMFSDNHRVHFQNRLLTPCSETDVIMTTQGYAASPTNELLHAESPFDFTPSGHCSHDQGSWHPSPSYPAFGMSPYDLDSYSATVPGFCEQSHLQADELCVPSAIMEPDTSQVSVKHECWDAQYHTI